MLVEAHTERVPKALFEGLLLTKQATWTKDVIRAWWSWHVASTVPEIVTFVNASRHLDYAVYALKDQAAVRRRWQKYCREDLHPQRILLGLERCVEAGRVDRVHLLT
jgi:hypothetical protein